MGSAAGRGVSPRIPRDVAGIEQIRCTGIWRLPLVYRRWLTLGGAAVMTFVVLGVFAPGFFIGPADWVIGLGGVLLVLLCLFGHFSWLLWMIGFIGWRSRPTEHIPADEPITTRTALAMPIYHEEVDRVAVGIRATWLSARAAELESRCDFFLLSDSVDPEIQAAEERAVQD